MQYLNTRIPEGRTVEGLEYGAHYSAPDRSWSGYWVRPADSDELPMMVARSTPATDEQEDSDADTVEAIEAEILERMSAAEHVAAAFGNDGQRWTHPVSGDTLAEAAEAQGAKVERMDAGLDEATRFAFPDGSAIVAKGGGWDIEGAEPYSWEGADEGPAPSAITRDQARGILAEMAGRRVTLAEEDHARIVDLTQALQTIQAIRRDVDGGEYEPAQADMAEQLANAADTLADEIGRRLVQDQIRR